MLSVMTSTEQLIAEHPYPRVARAIETFFLTIGQVIFVATWLLIAWIIYGGFAAIVGM